MNYDNKKGAILHIKYKTAKHEDNSLLALPSTEK